MINDLRDCCPLLHQRLLLRPKNPDWAGGPRSCKCLVSGDCAREAWNIINLDLR